MLETVRKLFQLFSRRERMILAGIFGVSLLNALIETFSVASIMPFMAVVADPMIVERNAALAWFHARVGAESVSGFLVFLGLVVLALLILSSAISALTTWLTMGFVWRKHDELSSRLFERYLRQPYIWFLNRNTSHLSKNLLNEALVVARGVLLPTVEIGVGGVVALFVLAFLVYVDSVLALAAGVVLGGGYLLLWTALRNHQRRVGREQVDLNTERYKVAGEAFGGIKELKALAREGSVASRYRAASRRYSEISVIRELVARLPRTVMELVAFGGILVVTVYLLASRPGIGEVLPVLSAFALGGYKLMPALQGVFAGLATVRFHAASLDDLHADLVGPVGQIVGEEPPAPAPGAPARSAAAPSAPAPPAPAPADSGVQAAAAARGAPVEAGPAGAALTGAGSGAGSQGDDVSGPPGGRPEAFYEVLALRDLTFTYPGAEEPTLRGVSILVRRGEVVGLVGATGSGKTTLVDLLLGLLPAPPGTLTLDGRALEGERVISWLRSVGYVPQEIFLSDESVLRNIAFGLPDEEIDPDRARRAARIARIDGFVRSLPDGYDTVVGERGVRISGGQRQRIGIARALYDDPPVLIFDEGTSALDGATEAEVTEAIRTLQPPKTVIWIAHRLRTVRESDRIYVLEDGKVLARGTYDELMRNEERFRAMARVGREEGP